MGVPGFDIAVYKGGDCMLRYMNGYSDIENKVKMQGNERYNIYSCSKVITCTAALQLWEKGLFSLEDKLSDYMPEFRKMTVRIENGVKKAENPILIKHLFEMTAGFSYDCYSPQLRELKRKTDGRCPTRGVMKYLAKEPLLFEPGDSMVIRPLGTEPRIKIYISVAGNCYEEKNKTELILTKIRNFIM